MGMLDDFKQQNPDYAGVDNNTLADALYAKYYSNMPRADYDAKLGLSQPPQQSANQGFWQRATQSLGTSEGLGDTGNPIPSQAASQAAGTGVREMAKGVPVLGAAVPQTPAMTEFEEKDPVGAGVGRAVGATAATLPLMSALPYAMGLEGGIGTRMGMTAASQGILKGADTYARKQVAGVPAGEAAKEAGTDALISSGIGGASVPAFSAIGAVIGPRISNAVNYLRDRGVPLTVGQTAGGFVKKLEDASESLPIMGGSVSAARERSVEGFNRAAADEVLSPLGINDSLFRSNRIQHQLPDTYPAGHARAGDPIGAGFDARGYTHSEIGRAYDLAYNNRVGFSINQRLQNDLTSIPRQAVADGLMTAESAQRYNDLIDGQVMQKFTNSATPGRLRGRAYGDIDAELRNQAERFSASSSAEDRNIGDAIAQARDRLSQEFSAQSPTAARRLAAADAAWARYVRLRTAGASTAVQGEEGLISPTQLQSAVQRSDKSYQKTAFSEGDALMQDLSHAGKQVIPSKLPNSGTADRLGIPALIAGIAANPAVGLPAAGGLGLGALAYTETGQAMLRALVAGGQSWRRPLGEAIRQYAPQLSTAAGQKALSDALGKSQ